VEGRPPTETDLVARAREGDARAYGELVRMHQGVAFRTAYLITRSAEDAEEAAQDAFVKAWAALGRFRIGEPLRPWLLQIVANEARNRRRSAGRRAALALRAEADAATEVAPSVESEVGAAEQRRALLAAVETLGERDRLVAP
jgi:RNA polymerase sigma-70 factor (ECF subfamily)